MSAAREQIDEEVRAEWERRDPPAEDLAAALQASTAAAIAEVRARRIEYTAHVAEVTEAAAREQIAQDIAARIGPAANNDQAAGLYVAAQIARGGA